MCGSDTVVHTNAHFKNVYTAYITRQSGKVESVELTQCPVRAKLKRMKYKLECPIKFKNYIVIL